MSERGHKAGRIRRITDHPSPITKLRVGVLMGGQSAEREVSLKSGQAVYRTLQQRGYDVVAIDVDAALVDRLRALKVEVAYLALHGPGGEDGVVQGLLESLGVPYTGSGVKASAIAMDKATAKTLLSAHGVPVPPGVVLTVGHSSLVTRHPSRTVPIPPGLRYPVVVKPVAQGSTIGVSVVRRPAEWAPALRAAGRYGPAVLVETYIAGREITVSVLDGPAGLAALPPVEIVAPGGFYDFQAKYQKGRSTYLCPAPLPVRVSRHLQRLAVNAYRVIGCAGAARVDFRVRPDDHPSVLEVNTIPGMTEMSLLPMAAAQAGIDYGALTERILWSALQRAERMNDAQNDERGTMNDKGKADRRH
jgi:D-alanine-D-alanine ligase